MKVGAFSATGKVRQINEDYYYIPQDINNDILLVMVADGMGGHKAGEIASKMAVELSVKYISENFYQYRAQEHGIAKLINEAILRANHAIFEKSMSDSEFEGMGSTLTIAVIDDDNIYIGHVGDSRAYIVKEENIYQITSDHSYVEQLIQNGTITREEAENHPQKNVITKAMGSDLIVEADIIIRAFQKNDKLLLCTDGLTNHLKNEQILEIIQSNESCQDTAEKLVESANDLGGTDNITAIIISN